MGNNSITFILFFGTDQHQIRLPNDNDLFKRKHRRRKIDSNYLQCDPLRNISFFVSIVIIIMIIIVNLKRPSRTELYKVRLQWPHTSFGSPTFSIFCVSYLVVWDGDHSHINLGLTRRCGEIGEPPVSP